MSQCRVRDGVIFTFYIIRMGFTFWACEKWVLLEVSFSPALDIQVQLGIDVLDLTCSMYIDWIRIVAKQIYLRYRVLLNVICLCLESYFARGHKEVACNTILLLEGLIFADLNNLYKERCCDNCRDGKKRVKIERNREFWLLHVIVRILQFSIGCKVFSIPYICERAIGCIGDWVCVRILIYQLHI